MPNPATNPVQVNLGTLNLNAWQQLMILNGTQVNTDATVGAHVLAPLVMAGFSQNVLIVSASGTVAITTRTALQTFQDILAVMGQIPAVGMSWEFEIVNTQGAATITLAAGAGVTLLAGTNTVTANGNRTWVLTYTGGGASNPAAGNPTFTLQSFASRSN